MRNGHRDVTFQGGDREKSYGCNDSAREMLGSIGLESQGELKRGTSNALTLAQRLGVPTSRALERRLGMPPTQEAVCKGVDALTSHSSKRSARFLQCAERVQAQLARLDSELQKYRERPSRIDIAQGTTASSIGTKKRPLEEPDHDSPDPPQEAKRARLENGNPNPLKSPPPPINAVRAQSAPMAPKHAPIALSDPQFAESSFVDPASPHARVDLPTQTPVTGTTSTDIPQSNSDREIKQRSPSHSTAYAANPGNRGHAEGASWPARRESLPACAFTTHTPAQGTPGMAPPPSTATSASETQQSPLSVSGTQPQEVIGPRTDLSPNSPTFPGVAVAAGLPAPPSPPAPLFVANVPGIWAIQVGKPSDCQIDLSFDVDQDTAECIRRWATRRHDDDPDVRKHVVVHLVALPAAAVSAAQQVLSQSPGSITPQAFALALHDLQPQWPDDGTLVLQMNPDQPEGQSWFTSDMPGGKSLDVSGAVLAGTNSLRILQLRNMAELVFALYATPPFAAVELERQRKLYSFRRPHSERLLG